MCVNIAYIEHIVIMYFFPKTLIKFFVRGSEVQIIIIINDQ